MTLTLSSINDKNFDRCVQMSIKTNQFNMTNLRFTPQTFENYLKKNNVISLVGSLKDKFGDHGITCMALAKKIDNKFFIDVFLLSCRIFGRNVEKILLQCLINKLTRKNNEVYGIYNMTKKNIAFKNFYSENGFTKKNSKQFVRKIKFFKLKKDSLIKIKYV